MMHDEQNIREYLEQILNDDSVTLRDIRVEQTLMAPHETYRKHNIVLGKIEISFIRYHSPEINPYEAFVERITK